MNKKKMDNNKGFTLVELIVVLVILAILAAILVPALLGYIDRAKGQQIVLNARSVYTATQAEMTSAYAKNKAPSSVDMSRIKATADVPGSYYAFACSAAYDKDNISHAMYTVTSIVYTENGQTVYLYDGEWVETKPTGFPTSLITIEGTAPTP